MNIENLKEKANNYAAEKVNEVLKEAFAKVYADGYHDGYKDREEEIPVDLRANKTEYVNLGLPSGTLWAADYEEDNDKIAYVPYEHSLKFNIPTKEQWSELFRCCEFRISGPGFNCIGPNGNYIYFYPTGYKVAETKDNNMSSYLWILDEDKELNAAVMWCDWVDRRIYCDTQKIFNGYKLPIRLVQIKK